MKEARHIATGKIVRASEVDYAEYYGIFQCPSCKVALRLRKEYTRSDGTTITAAFIHPPGETELQKKCPYRINMDFGNTEVKINFPHSREQCFKILKKNFLKSLKIYSKVSITEHYATNKSALESIRIFINLNKKIIAAPQNGRYILELTESKKIEKILQDKVHQRINSYDPKSIRRRIELDFLKSELDLVIQKSNSLIWVLEFLIYEASDDFMEETLDYIFGKYVGNQGIKGIELEYEISNFSIGNLSFGEIKKILGFELSIIKQADKILLNDKLINLFFDQMYKKEFLDTNALIFNETKKIHNAVFDYIINYLIDFPWKHLLY
ncbi:hypothetical protein [Aulosira sp. FACHB-615]|uniref:hypothetical protein n=1 Tax=Aulosira sp. FACHB-615 TaxID=2692777 RepID=UPI00168A3504|nr:hypothetical protein [Aulosira sp. FACHB-615]MBD2489848.1 hypothetical protein [Aulosira sp. FACHB-615]